MPTDTRPLLAPESYATFWQPAAAPTRPAPAEPAGEAKDAYLEFADVTEGAPAAARGERV